ncbi:thioredoxin-like protein [Ascodesmis nigricans]|uniref:Glutathione S-transferase kappa n=1 Tax=Ascodesmis nigricans TaxID=341454 RepID=A0A4S2MTG7_9PEZI|nr:thioredoxin-like protein [Ascodesmis nigricans]
MASITLYIDCVSNYGYMALHLVKTHFSGVPLKLVPVFLGGIMQATGNRPPFAVPLKGNYMKLDAERTCRRYNIPIRKGFPEKFPMPTLLAQRVQVAAGIALGQEKGNTVVEAFEKALWLEEVDIESQENCGAVLVKAVGKEDAGKVLKTLTENTDAVKEQLKKNTEAAIKSGSFGVPWFVVKDKDGKEDVIWGVDHIDLVAEMVGVQWPPAGLKKETAQL